MLTIDPGAYFSPVPSYSVLFKDTPTPEPDGLQKTAIEPMFLHDLYSVIGL